MCRNYLQQKFIAKEYSLKTAILKSRVEITIDQFRNLVSSMPKRIFEVIKVDDTKTRYKLLCLLHLSVFLFYFCIKKNHENTKVDENETHENIPTIY